MPTFLKSLVNQETTLVLESKKIKSGVDDTKIEYKISVWVQTYESSVNWKIV